MYILKRNIQDYINRGGVNFAASTMGWMNPRATRDSERPLNPCFAESMIGILIRTSPDIGGHVGILRVVHGELGPARVNPDAFDSLPVVPVIFGIVSNEQANAIHDPEGLNSDANSISP